MAPWSYRAFDLLQRMIKKLTRTIFSLILHLAAIAILAWVLWPFLNHALHVPKHTGYDSDQFVHYVHYYSGSLPLPPAGWDHLWFGGIPRVLDNAFLPHYLIQPLVAKLGLAMATSVYPLIWLGIFFFFSYLTLFRLSKNQVIAVALTAGLIHSQGVYLPIYENGVVTSGLAQMVFPLVLLFLVSFAQTESFRHLALAAVSLALMFYTHGALALVFGLAPALLFLAFCRIQSERLLSWVRIRRLQLFVLMTLGVGAIAILPQVLEALKGGGTYSRGPYGQAEANTEVFSVLAKMTHPALFVALALAGLVAILFYRRRKPDKLAIPLIAVLAYFLVLHLATMLGINPIGDFMFPGRSFWLFGLILAAISALLFAPLTQPLRRGWELLFPFGWVAIAGVIIAVVLSNPLQTGKLLSEPTQISPDKVQRDTELFSTYETWLAGIWDQVDQRDENFRVGIHATQKMFWNIISDIPQTEGYFHFYTKYSGEWQAWLFATLAEEAAIDQTFPQDMADPQARFLIDWYGIKYLIPYPGPEFNLAPRFWEENEYILGRSAERPPAVLTMRPEFTSGIVEAVDVPVVGFVGNDAGYDAFLRDLGMLNLNTHYLIPLRLTPSIDKLSKADLDQLDLLVLYNFKGGGRGWRRIAEFVKQGGSLFIETGGNPSLREGANLPEVFPADQLEFGSLGRDWEVEVTEELSAIDFEELEPLVYRDEPWKLSYVPDVSYIRGESKVLVTQAGKPVVAEREMGQGKVIWSGLNSWYRPWEFKESGMVEVQVLDLLLKRSLETSYQLPIEVKVNREKPEKIIVEGNNFSGVVFKENNLPGWKAWAEVNSKKQNLKIYAAGPDLMFVPLPSELEGRSVKVSLTYQGPWVYWLLFFVSIFSSIFVLIEIITNGFLTKRLKLSKIGKVFDPEKYFRTIRGWWDKEEDEE